MPEPQIEFRATTQRPTRRELALVRGFARTARLGAVAHQFGPAGAEAWSQVLRGLDRYIPQPELPVGTAITRMKLPHCRAELTVAPPKHGAPAQPLAIAYFHGGGFVGCGIRTYRPFAALLSRLTGASVLNVGYRLLPQATLPDAVEDCLDGYRRLLELGFPAERIVLAGDSAGGHLAFATALARAGRGLPRPAGVVAMSPWLDFDSTRKRAHPNRKLDPMIELAGTEFIVRKLITRGGALDPLLSPVNAPPEQLRALPPSLIHVGSTELLLPDAELMATRVAAAGGDCRLQVWEEMLHVFQLAGRRRPAAREALAEICGFIERTTNAPDQSWETTAMAGGAA